MRFFPIKKIAQIIDKRSLQVYETELVVQIL